MHKQIWQLGASSAAFHKQMWQQAATYTAAAQSRVPMDSASSYTPCMRAPDVGTHWQGRHAGNE